MKRLISLALTLCLAAALMLPTASAKEFADTKGHWAETAISEITDRGYFNGTSDTTFSPSATMTRGMFVAVLSRMASSMGLSIAHGDGVKFTDVNPTAYYADAVAWANENGIVQGKSDDTFCPNDVITRQQMCAILVRFLTKFAGLDLSGYTTELSFLDADSISSYAVEAVQICCAMGLINGVSVEGGLEFRPATASARATVAVVLSRFLPKAEELGLTLPEVEVPVLPEEEEDLGGAGGMGGAGGAGGPGGSGDSADSEVSEEQKQEETQVASYLETFLKNYNDSQSDFAKYLERHADQEVKDCMAILMGCVENALEKREDGTFLSKEFIRSEYNGQISELKQDYKELTVEQEDQLNHVVVRMDPENSESIFVVMDYFGVGA